MGYWYLEWCQGDKLSRKTRAWGALFMRVSALNEGSASFKRVEPNVI